MCVTHSVRHPRLYDDVADFEATTDPANFGLIASAPVIRVRIILALDSSGTKVIGWSPVYRNVNRWIHVISDLAG